MGPYCSECLNAKEDAIHSLWGYQVLTPLWAKLGLFRALQTLQFSSFAELLQEVLNELDEHH